VRKITYTHREIDLRAAPEKFFHWGDNTLKREDTRRDRGRNRAETVNGFSQRGLRECLSPKVGRIETTTPSVTILHINAPNEEALHDYWDEAAGSLAAWASR
jgi:hypothetical protein